MVSATDVITYIGVPLAVLGVFPLIFNLFKSIIIWRRLLASLPRTARSLLHFNVDPVGGTVGCSLDEISLECARLVESAASGRLKYYAQDVRVTNDDGLGATWMGMLEVDLPLHRRPDRRRRCVVDSSLRADISALSCDWQTFVYIALGFGVRPEDLEVLRQTQSTSAYEQSKELVLASDSKVDVMQVSLLDRVPVAKLEGQTLKFSLKRAFAWELIMVLPAKVGVEMVPLIEAPTGPTEAILGFLAPGHASNLQRELANATNTLEATLKWTLYFEQTLHAENHSHREKLPVPQHMLIVQQEAAEDLKNVPQLSAILKDIFPSKPSTASRLIEKLQVSTEKKEARQTSSSAFGKPMVFEPPELYMDIWLDLQQNDAFQDLLKRYNPSPRLCTEKPEDLSDMSLLSAVLARVVIVTSAIQKCQHEPLPWKTKLTAFGDTVWVPAQNPMASLLQIGETPPPRQVDLG